MKIVTFILLLLLAAVLAVSCSISGNGSNTAEDDSKNQFDLNTLAGFDITSEDLHDGVWDTVITNTKNGSNRSPQLSWKPVDGASDYVVYMVDTTANNWIHWKSVTSGKTDLPAGWASEKEYVGPYPPSGKHDYVIYVFALKESAGKIEGKFDSSCPKFFELIKSLDNEGGNIVAYGTLNGTYTHGD